MDEAKVNGKPPTEFIDELEASVRAILKNKKASKSDKLSAINAGTKILAIRHKLNGGGDSEGFFK